MDNVQNPIAPQIVQRKGYFILTIVKYIKYSKERSTRPSRVTLRAFKQKNSPFYTVALYIKNHRNNIPTPNIRKLYNYITNKKKDGNC